jgi:hypothetical protein
LWPGKKYRHKYKYMYTYLSGISLSRDRMRENGSFVLYCLLTQHLRVTGREQETKARDGVIYLLVAE